MGVVPNKLCRTGAGQPEARGTRVLLVCMVCYDQRQRSMLDVRFKSSGHGLNRWCLPSTGYGDKEGGTQPQTPSPSHSPTPPQPHSGPRASYLNRQIGRWNDWGESLAKAKSRNRRTSGIHPPLIRQLVSQPSFNVFRAIRTDSNPRSIPREH